jgi:hypothetical protein
MIPKRLLIFLATGALSALAYDGGAARDPGPLRAGPAATATPAADNGSGAIAGKALFSGTAPPTQRVKLSADPKCAALHEGGLERQPLKVKDGGLADVLV